MKIFARELEHFRKIQKDLDIEIVREVLEDSSVSRDYLFNLIQKSTKRMVMQFLEQEYPNLRYEDNKHKMK